MVTLKDFNISKSGKIKLINKIYGPGNYKSGITKTT